MDKIKEAWKIAERVHKSQKRFGGEPYIKHIQRVAQNVEDLDVYDEELQCVAILHDTIEDGHEGVADEIQKKLTLLIANYVEVLSHDKDAMPLYSDYIDNICRLPSDVIKIKIADIIDNLTDKPTPRMVQKYKRALIKLIKVL